MENDSAKHATRLADLYKLRARGMTYEEVANRTGISRQRVHQLLTGYKGKTRQLSSDQEVHLGYRRSTAPLRLRRKKQVLTHYGGGKLACVWCGFDDIRALSLDHIAGKKGKKGTGDALYKRLVEEGLPPGYQTLCLNCRYIKLYMRNETVRPVKRNRRKYRRHKKIS
jgi:transcriptional regulator with XRE-family HTH domain